MMLCPQTFVSNSLSSVQLALFIFYFVLVAQQSSAQLLRLIPDVPEQVVAVGSNITLTCIFEDIKFYILRGAVEPLSWTLPDYNVKYPELSNLGNRLNKMNDNGNEKFMSTMTLKTWDVRETGYYVCTGRLRRVYDKTFQINQYVYVYGDNDLAFIDDPSQGGITGYTFTFQQGNSGLVPCKSTHPNVTITITTYLTNSPILLSESTSNWEMEPKRGITLKRAMISDTNRYNCIGSMNNLTTRVRHLYIIVEGMELIRMNDTEDPLVGSNVTLICRISRPNYSSTHNSSAPEWSLKKIGDNEIIRTINETNPPEGIQINTVIESDMYYESRLELFDVTLNTSTTIFQCKSTVNNKVVSKEISFQIKELPVDINAEMITAFAIAVIVPIIVCIGIGLGIKKYYDKKKVLFPGAENLLRGNRGAIDGEFTIEEQIEYLPYDKRWEFPRHRLKLGKQIGVGCFGRVLKAEAVGIRDPSADPDENSCVNVKTVAVKMVKSENDTDLKALASEMKILIYLGSHLNVVNLLGACTKKVHRGELLVIVEYCRFGNLQAYLTHHRNQFINQLDEFGNLKPQTDTEEMLDVHRHRNDQSRIESESQNNSTCDSNVEIEMSNLNISLKPIIASEEPEPFWQCQQDPDNPDESESICTRDLISWSFQISRGMDYLTSKKVLHGDLAARNVLLADNGVAKIADFGMARKMYYDGNYEKKGQGLMPVKWMAIESLTDRIFTTQSDVWSYGVLLWEMFSLGKVPYPGMEAGHHLLKEIQNGYRMDKPEIAPNFMGEIMDNCWKVEPKERPTFSQIEEIISKHMESSVSSHYLNLNAPYVRLNEDKENATSKDLFGLAKLLND
uniref:receptor protein-tyrosine kinase n=1 Tax=Daphnia galeata TaxID=27404 RepID=A0A8J2S2A5_9CRUS|nr:unnamed protein product [Daphnia galeata]